MGVLLRIIMVILCKLIYLLPRVFRPRRVLIVQPAFSGYLPALSQVGSVVDSFALRAEEDFQFSVDKLIAAMAPETEMVLLATESL